MNISETLLRNVYMLITLEDLKRSILQFFFKTPSVLPKQKLRVPSLTITFTKNNEVSESFSCLRIMTESNIVYFRLILGV